MSRWDGPAAAVTLRTCSRRHRRLRLPGMQASGQDAKNFDNFEFNHAFHKTQRLLPQKCRWFRSGLYSQLAWRQCVANCR